MLSQNRREKTLFEINNFNDSAKLLPSSQVLLKIAGIQYNITSLLGIFFHSRKKTENLSGKFLKRYSKNYTKKNYAEINEKYNLQVF